MDVVVEVPDLGIEGGDRATVSVWHYEEQDRVEKGDVLAELVCESETIEVHSPYGGIVIERIVEEDEPVRVGEPLCVIETEENGVVDEDEAGE